jgi:two-component system, repressor protein LuxO
MTRRPSRPATAASAALAPAGDILVIEDTLSLQLVYRALLNGAGHSVRTAATAVEGLRLCDDQRPGLVLLDLMLPDRDGLALLGDILNSHPGVPVVAVTANGSIQRAVEAMRAGAHDFLVKPVEETRFLAAVDNALRARDRATRVVQRAPTATSSGFIGSSPVIRRVESKIRSVAASMATVFITGESGTGKELAALAVHQNSARAKGPFIALNCGAIPQDLLESEVFGHVRGSFTGAISDKPGAAAAADGGTLFLDEVCEMVPALQTKLLRFLQTSTITPVGATRPSKVDVRIVCATNRDPLDAVRRGQFREDLYYRLYVVPIHMPPLRDRDGDVVEIAESALAAFSAEEGRRFEGLSPEVRALFRAHPWPGNVRQVLNVIRNVVVLNDGGIVTPAMLPPSLTDDTRAAQGQTGASPGEADPFAGLTLAEIERRAVQSALDRHGGSVPRAARELDIAPSTLYRKLDAWGLPRA